MNLNINNSNFNFLTLNINGLNVKDKQEILVDYLKSNQIHCCLLQEHNLKDETSIYDVIRNDFDIFLNPTIRLKGGTLTLISKHLKYNVIYCEKSHDSRILSLKIKVDNQILHLLNVYAPSGNRYKNERDELFKNEILYYLRGNLGETIWAGDFNCVLSENDISKENPSLMYKSLLNTIRQIRFIDAWWTKNTTVEYTYIQENYGSRIDRIYLSDLRDSILDIKTQNVSFSDHAAVIMKMNLDSITKKGSYYWKMNVNLLISEEIKENFREFWQNCVRHIYNYNNICEWWEQLAKPQIKKFFIKQGKISKKLALGKIKYLEHKLHRICNEIHNTGNLDFGEVKRLKSKINDLKSEMLEGVKIRAKILENTDGEKPSAYLLGKEVKPKKYSLITKLRCENSLTNNIISGQQNIEKYINESYEKLYKKKETCNRNKEWFLSLVEKVIDDHENTQLTKDMTLDELSDCIKSLDHKKSPGIDGIPAEFYQLYWDIIKEELYEMVLYSLNNLTLSESQYKALII